MREPEYQTGQGGLLSDTQHVSFFFTATPMSATTNSLEAVQYIYSGSLCISRFATIKDTKNSATFPRRRSSRSTYCVLIHMTIICIRLSPCCKRSNQPSPISQPKSPVFTVIIHNRQRPNPNSPHKYGAALITFRNPISPIATHHQEEENGQ